MAVFVSGMKCGVCNKIIENEKKVISFPPFVSNSYDPIYMFSDAVFHSNCFYEHPLSERAETRLNELKSKTGPGKRVCRICDNQIMNPEEYLGLGYLTEDIEHPLFDHNYDHYHRSCLKYWSELPKLYELLNGLQKSGKWGGNGLKRLLEDIKKLGNL